MKAARCLLVSLSLFVVVHLFSLRLPNADETWVRVPEDYPTIQKGIAALKPDGGTVYISAGSYQEDAAPGSGWNETATLTLDGGGSAEWEGDRGSCFSLSGRYTQMHAVRLRGIHFVRGYVSARAPDGPMDMDFAVENCTFTGDATRMASVIVEGAVSAAIQDCLFEKTIANQSCLAVRGFKQASLEDCDFVLYAGGSDAYSVVTFDANAQNWSGESDMLEISRNRIEGADLTAAYKPLVRLYENISTVRLHGNDFAGVWILHDEQPPYGEGEIIGNRASCFVGFEDTDELTGPGRRFLVRGNEFLGIRREVWPWYDRTQFTRHRTPAEIQAYGNTFGYLDLMVGSGVDATIAPSAVSVRGNNVMEFASYRFTPPGNLSGNYWGHLSGPDEYFFNPDGEGATLYLTLKTSPTVYRPWLTSQVAVPIDDDLGGGGDEGMKVSLRASPEAGHAPLDVRLAASVSGGKAPYFYGWSIDGILVTTATAQSSLDWRFTIPDFHSARVSVFDTTGATAGDGILVRADKAVGKIWGHVRDDDTSAPLTSARLKLFTMDEELFFMTSADQFGEYSFKDVPLGTYNLQAEAPEYASERRIIQLATPAERKRVEFRLFIPLGMERRKIKQALIDELIRWPAINNYSGVSVGTPYRPVELDAQSWLNAQTNVTEELKRLEMAEYAVKDGTDQAMVLAKQSSQMWGAFASQVMGILVAIPKIDEMISNSSAGGVYQFRSNLFKRIAWRMQKRFSRIVSLGRWTPTRRGQHLIMSTIEKFILSPAAGRVQGATGLESKGFVAEVLYRKFLAEYGEATRPWLVRALSAAQGGGPYPFSVEESKGFMEDTLLAADQKTKIALRAVNTQSNVSWATWSAYTALDYWGEILRHIRGSDPRLGSLVKSFEIAFRLEEAFGTYLAAEQLTGRLLEGLPDDVAEATANAFGDLLILEPERASLGGPSLLASSVATATMAVAVPSTHTVDGELEACRAAVVADNFANLETTVQDQLSPALDSFSEAVSRAVDQAELLAGPDGEISPSLSRAINLQELGEMIFLTATLDFLFYTDSPRDLGGSEYLGLKEEYFGRIDTFSALNEDLVRALAEATSGSASVAVPVTVAVRDAWFSSGGERVDSIQTTPQSFVLNAVVENLTNGAADGVLVGAHLFTSGSLALDGSPATQTIGTLGPNETRMLTWNVQYDGPLYDRIDYARVQVASDTPAAPLFQAGASADALLTAFPFPDADLDGMDDDWEATMGLDNATSADAVLDLDGDGLDTIDEFSYGTDPRRADTDADGMKDGVEIDAGLDPLRKDGDEDPDGDGLSNVEEIGAGSDPFNPDSDGDGFSDGIEVAAGSSPLDPDSTPQTAGMISFAAERIANGWGWPGIDAAEIDLNRNGRIDVGDIMQLRDASGTPADPATIVLLGPGSATGAAERISRVPILLSPEGVAAAFSIEIQFDPAALEIVNTELHPAMQGRQFAAGQPVPGRLIVVSVGDAPPALPGWAAPLYLLVRPRAGLPVSTRIPIEAVAADVADAAGNLLPNVDLRQGRITLTTPAHHWSLYR